MPSPTTGTTFDVQNFSGNVCERVRKLLELNDTLKIFFEWMFNADGTVSDAFKLEIQDIAVAPGNVVFRPIASVPSGYLIANGQAVSRTLYANLFAVYGTTFGPGDGSTTFNLPNFSGYFLMGSGPAGANPVGSTGGAATVTLDETQIPAHTHTTPWRDNTSGAGSSNQTGTATQGPTITVETSSAGGGQAHENLPPYKAGYWLVKY